MLSLKKLVYRFQEGNLEMKSLLEEKANLSEMTKICSGSAWLIITTEACNQYYKHDINYGLN